MNTLHYFDLDRKLSFAVGLWPFQRLKDSLPRRVVVNLLLASLSLVTVAAFPTANWNVEYIAETTSLIAMFIGVETKYFTARYDAAKLRKLYNVIERDLSDQFLSDPEESKLKEVITEAGKRYNLYFARLLYIMECGYCISPFSTLLLDVFVPLNESRPLQQLYTVEYNIDPEKYYYLILLHLFVGTTVSFTVAIATDVMMLSTMCHARYLCRLAGYRLRRAFSESKEKVAFNNRTDVPFKNIIRGVESHRKAIKYFTDVHDVFECCSLATTICGIASMTVTMFCFVAFVGEWKKMIMYTLSLIGQISYAFFMIYPTQQMMEEGFRIFSEIYNAQWYAAPLASQKIMLLVMQRTMTPMIYVIGKIIPLSMVFLSKLIQTCLSYCMVLFSIR